MLSAMTFVSCNGDYDDWADPQSNPQEEAVTLPGYTATAADPIDLANPGTSAKQNRNYFEGLKDQSGSKTVSASSHYIIGSDGTILQCIPLDEVAYGNYPRNDDTVSIECCHPDSDGRFTDATIKSLIRLTGWLCRELSLNEKHIIRHYDVSGKNCPKYYVEHQDAWRTLKKKLAAGIQQ